MDFGWQLGILPSTKLRSFELHGNVCPHSSRLWWYQIAPINTSFLQDSVDLLCRRRWWNPLVSSCSAIWPDHLLFFTSCCLAPWQCCLLWSVPLQALPLMFYPISGTTFCPPVLYPVAGTASTSLSVRAQLFVQSHELWPLQIRALPNMLTNDNHFSGAM